MDRINQLRTFLRVAASGSFTQAADQLNLPRATVTLAVQQLEARLGARLLHRTTRRVSLTQDGEALLERATALVADLDDLEQHFRPAAGAIVGRLRVDVPSRVARRLLAPALPTFLREHPKIEIDLGSSDRAIDLVREGVDCALRVGTLASSGLIARPLGVFEMVSCASPAYLSRHGTPTTVNELDRHTAVNYISPTTGRVARWEWQDDGGEARSRTLHGRVRVNNVETYIACALAGLGLIQVPRYDVREHLQAGELVEVLPAHCPPPMPVHLVYAHRKQLSRRMQAFVAWVEPLVARA